ncbi:hypothetical protein G6F40_016342 [Rhizopus arrhizus]|nr:hypothetical protein G6F40_016342 [Rhizopus arrhizus]
MVVVRGDARRQQRRRKMAGLALRHERDRHHPQQRRQADQGQHQQRTIDHPRVPARLADFTTHTNCLLRPKRSITVVTARMIRNSRNATAEARPRFHHLKPSSNMNYSTLTVLCSGSPRVIT